MRTLTHIENKVINLLGHHVLHSLISNAGLFSSPKDLCTRIEFVIVPKLSEMSIEKLAEIISYSDIAVRSSIVPWGCYEKTFHPDDPQEVAFLSEGFSLGGKSLLVHLANLTVTTIAFELIRFESSLKTKHEQVKFEVELADYIEMWMKHPTSYGNTSWPNRVMSPVNMCEPVTILEMGSGVYAVQDSWDVVDIFFDPNRWACDVPVGPRCQYTPAIACVTGRVHDVENLSAAEHFARLHLTPLNERARFNQQSHVFFASIRNLEAMRHW
jgi:hypothetical protein